MIIYTLKCLHRLYFPWIPLQLQFSQPMRLLWENYQVETASALLNKQVYLLAVTLAQGRIIPAQGRLFYREPQFLRGLAEF